MIGDGIKGAAFVFVGYESPHQTVADKEAFGSLEHGVKHTGAVGVVGIT